MPAKISANVKEEEEEEEEAVGRVLVVVVVVLARMPGAPATHCAHGACRLSLSFPWMQTWLPPHSMHRSLRFLWGHAFLFLASFPPLPPFALVLVAVAAFGAAFGAAFSPPLPPFPSFAVAVSSPPLPPFSFPPLPPFALALVALAAFGTLNCASRILSAMTG